MARPNPSTATLELTGGKSTTRNGSKRQDRTEPHAPPLTTVDQIMHCGYRSLPKWTGNADNHGWLTCAIVECMLGNA